MKTIKTPKTLKPLNKGEIAKRLGISPSYFSLILNGKRKPSETLANKIKRMGVLI